MNWSRFIPLLSSLMLLSISQYLSACGPSSGVNRYEAHYRFLHADGFFPGELKWDSIINAKDRAANNGGLYLKFMGHDGYSDYDIMYDWARYINRSHIHTESIATVVIPLPVAHWLAIDSFVNGIKPALDSALWDNDFVKLLKKDKRNDITRLMVFLKRGEKWSDPYNYPRQQEGYYGSRDVYELRRDILCLLLEEGKVLYKNEPDRFLKMRYAHQLVRLANYIGDYSHAIALFKATFEDLPCEHAIEEWMMMQYAGALARSEQQALANYYFIKVMRSGSEKAEVAFTSIKIRNQAEWDGTMALCTTDEERSWLYYSFYQANKRVGMLNKTAILGRILAEDADNDYAKSVAIQLINQLEAELLPLRQFMINSLYNHVADYDEEAAQARELEAPKAAAKFNQIIEKALPNMPASKHAFWQMANGYIYFLQGNQAQATKWLSKVGEGDPMAAEYAQLFLFYIKLQKLGNINARTEEALLPTLHWVEREFDKQAAQFAYVLLAQKYRKQNDHGKALMLSCKDVCYDTELEWLDVSLPFMEGVNLREKQQKTHYESWLLMGGLATSDELREYHLMGLLADFKFKEAAKHSCTFRTPYNRRYYFPNPFILYPNNIIYTMSGWESYRPANQHYNRHIFAWEMGALMDSLKQNPTDKGRFLLQLATGMAHMHKDGGAWFATAFFKSASRNGYNYSSNSSKAFKGDKQVLAYFNSAYQNLKNEEQKAEALFGMIWYLELCRNEYNDKETNLLVSSFIEDLYDQYRDTRYYEETIMECEMVYRYSAN